MFDFNDGSMPDKIFLEWGEFENWLWKAYPLNVEFSISMAISFITTLEIWMPLWSRKKSCHFSCNRCPIGSLLLGALREVGYISNPYDNIFLFFPSVLGELPLFHFSMMVYTVNCYQTEAREFNQYMTKLDPKFWHDCFQSFNNHCYRNFEVWPMFSLSRIETSEI